jgi:RHS repeat-associated protein
MAMNVVYTTLGGRIVYENRGGVERSYLRDPLGNTVGLMDMSGNVTDTYDYWPYGETRVHSGSSKTPLTFLGTFGYFTDFVNMLYVRARHLRVDLTQWMSLDRHWPRQNPYAYVRTNPCSVVDPSGRVPVALLVVGLLNIEDPVGWIILGGLCVCATGAVVCTVASHPIQISTPMDPTTELGPPPYLPPIDTNPYECEERCGAYCEHQSEPLFWLCVENCLVLCDATGGIFPPPYGGGSFGNQGPFQYPQGPVWA